MPRSSRRPKRGSWAGRWSPPPTPLTGDLRATPGLLSFGGMRDLETIDSELRLVAALRRAARERGGPLPLVEVADALLDERREWSEQV
jgi:hypothetical protein